MRGFFALGFAGAALVETGCSYAYAHVDSPEEATRFSSVKLTRTDHSVLQITNAAIVGDSVIAVTDDDEKLRVAVAIKDIRGIEARKLNKGRTLFLVVGGATAAALWYVILNMPPAAFH